MNDGYTKLFGSLVFSSMWRSEPNETRIVWITMLALADQDGVVISSVQGLADCAKVTKDECKIALERFMSPDEDSTDKDHEGRRIEKVDRGWLLLNHWKFREKMSEGEKKEKAAARQARWRERHLKKSKPLPGEEAYVKAEKNGSSQEVLDRLSEPKEKLAVAQTGWRNDR